MPVAQSDDDPFTLPRRPPRLEAAIRAAEQKRHSFKHPGRNCRIVQQLRKDIIETLPRLFAESSVRVKHPLGTRWMSSGTAHLAGTFHFGFGSCVACAAATPVQRLDQPFTLFPGPLRLRLIRRWRRQFVGHGSSLNRNFPSGNPKAASIRGPRRISGHFNIGAGGAVSPLSLRL